MTERKRATLLPRLGDELIASRNQNLGVPVKDGCCVSVCELVLPIDKGEGADAGPVPLRRQAGKELCSSAKR